MTLYEELKWRGLVYNISDEALIDKLNKGELTFYLGADPTGDSLHVGHLVTYLVAKRLEAVGNKPIFLIGGATGTIGDPKPTAERQLLSLDVTQKNAECLTKQVKKMFNCQVVNNLDWTKNLNVLDFLRDFGKFFNINYMINKETVKARLDTGISFTEFSYQILQAMDYEYLFSKYGCNLQIGGQDQWGNITGGLELIRKVHGVETQCYALTIPLILKSDGTKFGKTEGGAVWLDPLKTSPYHFYQFWINTPDDMVILRLKQFTFLNPSEIEALEQSVKDEPHLRKAQTKLAEEMTKLIHGEEALKQAQNITQALFSGEIKKLTPSEVEIAFSSMPKVQINEDTLLIDALVLAGAAKSKREAREFISNGAVLVNGEQQKSLEYMLTSEQTLGKYIILRRGKKNYYCIEYEK